jgi:DNA-binding transcriptional LysR family regulator
VDGVADRFEDLRNYVAVVANGGVNAAADALGIAKSAVSRRLAELEARLGVTLIDRTTRRFELTAVGRDYHRRAVDLLASLDDLDRSVAGEMPFSKRISVGVGIDLAPQWLVPAMARFALAHEGVTIALGVMDGTSQPDDADILILTSAGAQSLRETRRIGEFRTVLCGAPAYLEIRGEPSKVTDLGGHSGVAVVGQERGWMFGGPAPQTFKVAMVVNDAASAVAAAIEGAGLCLVPQVVAQDAIDAGKLKIVLASDEPTAATVHASFASESPAAVRRLVDQLAATLGPQR